ncbi:MAG: carboxypeptidase regulatory-like domain-containing protein [Chitinophagaceae bacterium]|nr:carboxypeptidase regulatory-like domain-containing protein [Chitinophagaceae bacterium]
MFRLFCILFLFISFPALAQSGQLTGIVTDATDQSPIDFATVVVKPANGTKVYGGKSNQQGVFTISNLPDGIYTVSI